MINNWQQHRKNIRCLIFDENSKVIISGFLRDKRKLGKLLFLKICDVDGEIQVIVKDLDIIKTLECKKESVVVIEGVLKKKLTPNLQEEFGAWEICATACIILSNATETSPIPIGEYNNFSNLTQGSNNLDEKIRLKYRYLDLRLNIKQNLIFKSKVKHCLFNFFINNDFVDISTPILSIPTQEGANTFKTKLQINNQEKEFSLSQSPQLYKQILMIGGFEKYFQFVNAFRLEDLREDRQYEFTQLDIEIAYQTTDYLFKLIENAMKQVFKNILKQDLKTPFSKLSYKEAYEKYGCDKPDLRFDLEIIDLSHYLTLINQNSEKTTAKFLFGLPWDGEKLNIELLMKDNDIKIHWAKLENNEIIGDFYQDHLIFLNDFFAKNKGYLFFISSDEKFKNFELSKLGKIRNWILKKFNLNKKNDFFFVWIIDWPLFEFNVIQNKWVVSHHLFTRPKNCEKSIEIETDNSCGYDLVFNGVEIASGSERIYDKKLQIEMFKKSGMSDEDIEENFSWFLNAMNYGVPPHAGIAIGFDRLIQLLLKEISIREVIAFPKNNHGSCQLTNSPKLIKR